MYTSGVTEYLPHPAPMQLIVTDLDMNNMIDNSRTKVDGYLKIYDPSPATYEVFFDGPNAVHYENMSIALANSIADRGIGFIYEMAFGNGGTAVDPTGIITYLTPNSSGSNASLYNKTYAKVVDDRSSNNADPTRNFIEVRHVTGTNYTDVYITCLLDYGEPAGQSAYDINTNNESAYVFDELGLTSLDASGNSLLLTHVLFHPVQKSLNRLIQVEYTVRIQTLV
jgi:hypothetical protein